MADVRIARDKIDYYKGLVQFFDDVQRVISKRGDILIALLRLDEAAIIAEAKGQQLSYFDAVKARKRWNQIDALINSNRWGQGPL